MSNQKKGIRMEIPKRLHDIVESYQDNEKLRYGKQSSKSTLFLKMMDVGRKKFQADGVKFLKEYHAYNRED